MANKNVNILLKLQDRFTGPMRACGAITKDQEKAMRKVSTSVIGFSRNVRSAFVSGVAHAAKFGAALGGITATVAGVAVKSYSDYEQLVGGLDTLFGDLAGAVEQNASQAFRTAGLSTNEYMETAMGFAASLNQSLIATEGNIAHAADYTDMAVTDMADNMNKMGSSMESIQNAYQGFAKQNYTMLDNLKLGYGGTKEEMERLLSDAKKLSGVSYSLENFSDIVQAIHVIQDEMGITGTTAREASETIAGSLGATKSAWKNLLTGIAIPDADIGGLVDDLVSSAGIAVRNIAPAAARAVKGVVTAVKELLPSLKEELGGLMDELVDELVPARYRESLEKVKTGVLSAWEAVKPVLQAALEHADKLVPAVLGVVGAVSGISVVSDVVGSVSGLVGGFKTLKEAGGGLAAIIAKKGGLVPALKALTSGFNPVLMGIGLAVSGILYLWTNCEGFRNAVKAIGSAIVKVWKWIADQARQMYDHLRTIFAWLETKFETLKRIIDGIKQAWKDLTSGSWLGANEKGFVSRLDIGGNATGTPYWKGGPTYVNEGRRGEIIDLPSGTRIIPHDVAAKAAGRKPSVTVNVTVQGNVLGNRAFMEQTGEYVARQVLGALATV